jgi:hypothetical protein
MVASLQEARQDHNQARERVVKDRPFDVTKAVDFSDAQIAETWVDLAPNDGFQHLADPRSTMPLILLGGKGSGRTHLMRYYSYPVQKVRAGSEELIEFLRKEGYVGIYMRCEGLNAGRFEGKGQPAETWAAVFAYYMDLWLSELTLIVVRDAFASRAEFAAVESAVSERICQLFDQPPDLPELSLKGVVAAFTRLRRQVDIAVNNAALLRSLGDLTVTASRGRLVSGVPRVLTDEVPLLKRVQFDYLIDELENLSESQQEYVNTLIREKTPPCTFVVGARLYGFRTRRTLSAGEENKAGSEYEQVLLDEHLREDPRYDDFARRLIIRRLLQAGYTQLAAEIEQGRRRVDDLFEGHDASRFEDTQTRFALDNYPTSRSRPWMTKLRTQLETLPVADSKRLADESVERIVSAVECYDYPLLEKTNAFLLYQDWAAGRDLLEAAAAIEEASKQVIAGSASDRHEHVLGHFKGDLLAQMLREGRQRQRYAGLQAFIDMSSGLPRHLLIVLKYVHRWAVFMGESPFTGTPISLQAQRAGVLQAANWFYDDAKASGAGSGDTHDAVGRLAQLLRLMRFSDKPVESSLTTFSFQEALASPRALEVIRRAHHASLLLRVATGAKDRNDEGVIAKYQLNPMLSPRYDLPLARRGTVGLNKREVEAIFIEGGEEFDAIVADRMARMNAPFRKKEPGAKQSTLPGLE